MNVFIKKDNLLVFTPEGIYCPQAGVYLDPLRKVEKALISHAHSDHARAGSLSYLCSAACEAPLRHRLGKKTNIETLSYGRKLTIRGVDFSFHPAGHVPGSAQIRVEHKGDVWVYSGDYKLEDDGISDAFEPVKCNTFITETTFALPVYSWKPQSFVFEEINAWWRDNARQGIVSVIIAYSLGKAQRILKYLDTSLGNMYAHPAISELNQVFMNEGIQLPPHFSLPAGGFKGEIPRNAMILLPPAAAESTWLSKHEPVSKAFASGWMSIRGSRRRSAAPKGFALSDHADWPSLIEAVKLSEASRIITTHGYKQVFARWLNEQGWNAEVSASDYYSGDETADQ